MLTCVDASCPKLVAGGMVKLWSELKNGVDQCAVMEVAAGMVPSRCWKCFECPRRQLPQLGLLQCYYTVVLMLHRKCCSLLDKGILQLLIG